LFAIIVRIFAGVVFAALVVAKVAGKGATNVANQAALCLQSAPNSVS